MFSVFHIHETHRPDSLHRQLVPQPLGRGSPARHGGDFLDVQSAGSNPASYVHPLAVKVMAEMGVDNSVPRSKHMNEFLVTRVETVITV